MNEPITVAQAIAYLRQQHSQRVSAGFLSSLNQVADLIECLSNDRDHLHSRLGEVNQEIAALNAPPAPADKPAAQAEHAETGDKS